MARLKAGNGAYHLILDDIPLLLAPQADPKRIGRQIGGRTVPAAGVEAFSPPIYREYAGFEAGMDYSRRNPAVPNGYSWGRNIDTSGGVAMPAKRLHELDLSGLAGTLGTVLCGTEYNGNLFFFGGGVGVSITAGYQEPPIYALGLNSVQSGFQAASCAVYLNKLYIGGQVSGAAAYLWELDTAGTPTNAFTANGTSGAKRWLLGTFYRVDPATASGADTFIGTDGGSSFKFTSSSNPLLDNNWGSTNQVGDTAYSISSIATTGETAWFVKQEGVFRVNRFGHAANVTPNWKDQLYQYNGVASLIKNGVLYANTRKGIDTVRGLNGQVNPSGQIQPGAEIAAEHPIWGHPYAMATDGDDLIAAFYNPSNQTSYICRGRARSEVPGSPGIKSFIWHGAFRVIVGERVTCLLVNSPFGNPRLWIWTVDTGGAVHGYWQALPKAQTLFQEWLSGGSDDWETDASLYLGSDTWDRGPSTLIVLDRMSVIGQGLSATALLEIYGAADGGDYAKFGPSVTQNGYQTTRITSSQTGRRWDFRVDFTGSDTTPPILRALMPRAEISVEPTEMLTIPVMFGDGVERRPGHGKDHRNPETVWRQIQQRMGGVPLTLVDWYGRTMTVTLKQDASWIESEIKTDEQWSITAMLTFTIKRRSWNWGTDGVRYASGESWGV